MAAEQMRLSFSQIFAVALRTLEIYEERDIFGHAAQLSEPFLARLNALAEHPLVGDARGVGLMGALELVADKHTKAQFPAAAGIGAHCAQQALEHGLIVRNLGDCIALCPPLIVSEAQVDELFTKLEKALDDTLAHVNAA